MKSGGPWAVALRTRSEAAPARGQCACAAGVLRGLERFLSVLLPVAGLSGPSVFQYAPSLGLVGPWLSCRRNTDPN
ncbi:hypothetical protein chiPu_0013365 [Chiloscyllium punctatum]|uniref:Uncharacterized protein n=1 Tax=Chiloscyllium punctatum TaxID=137246 RepID=A0A401SWX4_CHIPU|nr:hypothetical protein [Chiloscyllium punctatum]